MYSILVAVDVFIAAGLIGLVLIQHGKGASAGAAFGGGGGGGGGASGTVFGAKGSGSFLTRATAILATLFFINSIVLAYLASHRPVAESVVDSATVIEAPLGDDADIPDLPIPDGEIGGDAIIDQIKAEIEQQASQLESDAQESLPSDVPGADDFKESMMELEKQSGEAEEMLNKALEEGNDAINQLPEDVPQ